MTALIWVALTLLGAVLGAELVAWSAPVHRFLLRWAARALPAEFRPRYVEEWQGELAAMPDGPLTRLAWVLSLVVRRQGLARALGGEPAGAAFGAKRIFDVAVSSLALVALAPLLACISLLVRAEMGPGIMFKAQREGRGGRTFGLLKFRTLSTTPPRGALRFRFRRVNLRGQTVYMGPVGRSLRKYSMDELPQIANVLKGDMSLVGPLTRRADADASTELREPLQVRPGFVGEHVLVPMEDWSNPELDKRYVEKWSLIRDLWIVLKMVSLVWRGKV